MTITGTAAPGSTVAIYFRKRGQSGYNQRRSITVGVTGRFTTNYLADDDYRYYAAAAVAGAASASQLRQIRPTVDGALNRIVKRNATCTITGTSIPNTTVTIHFHRAGTALNDYSIARRVTVGGAGSWARPYLATSDYRFYVTSDANSTRTASYLIQAR